MDNKYNEIMDHIEMSEEMQSRILSNVDRQLEKKKRRKILRLWLPVAGVAVAAAILLMVTKPWSGRTPVASTVNSTEVVTDPGVPIAAGPGDVITGGSEDPEGTENPEGGEDSSGIYQMKGFSTAQELEKAAGFPVKDLTAIPFKADQKEYRLIAGTIAEENYVGSENELSFRKSKGQEDNSGVYEAYSVTKTAKIQGSDVTMTGDNGAFNLICWTDDQYAYSLYSVQGISEKAVLDLVEEIMK